MEVPIRVVARVKPVTSEDGSKKCLEVAPASSQIVVGFDNFYDFDAVYGETVSQKQVYCSCLADIIINFFRGFNSTVISYGQHGTGKTYSLTGPDFLWAMNEEEFGLLPQAVRHIFKLMNEVPEREYRVHVSYLIINQEAVYDLLSPNGQELTPLNVLEDSLGNVVIPGLTVGDCSNISEVLNCLEAGLLRKHTASSQGFDLSTAHTMFNFTLEHQWTGQDGRMCYIYSRLSFVDLAGTNHLVPLNFSGSGSDEESVKNEILVSNDLKAVSHVVQCLVNKKYEGGVVPYRNSRLTHILKDSFGGSCITLLLCCVSALGEDLNASLETMKFGSMVRYVVNVPSVNFLFQNAAPSSSRQSLPNVAGSSSVWSSQHSSPSGGNVSNSSVSLNCNFRTINPPLPPPMAVAPQPFPQSHNYNSSRFPQFSEEQTDFKKKKKDTEEIFNAQFAVSQLHLLVSSAERLLVELLSGGSVSSNEKSRIQSWLWTKAETDKCIASDAAPAALPEGPSESSRPLEVIEEVSEPSEMLSDSVPSSAKSDSDASSSDESLDEAFYLRLENLRQSFFTLTLDLIKETEQRYLADYEEFLMASVEGESACVKSKDDAGDEGSVASMSVSQQSELSSSLSSRPDLASVTKTGSASAAGDGSSKSDPVQDINADNGVHGDAVTALNWQKSDVDISERIEMQEFGHLDLESDKENLASNFGSRLSLISNHNSSSSSVSSSGGRHCLKPARSKSKRKRRSAYIGFDGFKKMSVGTKSAAVNQDSTEKRQSASSFPPPVDIMKYSREVEASLSSRGEEDDACVSSEKELIKRVSTKIATVSKGSKYVNNIRAKSFQLKRSIRSHIFKKRNKANPSSNEESRVEPRFDCGSSTTESSFGVRRVSDDLKAAKERLEELKATIGVKEAFIEELKQSGAEAKATERKCEVQLRNLHHELNEVTARQEEARAKMLKTQDESRNGESERRVRDEIYDCNWRVNSLRKKIEGLRKVSFISQQNDEKVMEVEKSLRSLREEQEELLTKFREELQWKRQLEERVMREGRCARNPLCSSSKLFDEKFDDVSDDFTDENDDVVDGTAASAEPSVVTASAVRNRLVGTKKRKLANSTTGDSQSETSVKVDRRSGSNDDRRVSLSSNLLHEKRQGSDCPLLQPDFIRKEIGLIRGARDALIAKRQKFDKKIRKGHVTGDGTEEERKLLEYDEAVEGLDAIIERKNVLLLRESDNNDAVLLTSTIVVKNDLEQRIKNLPLSELHFLLLKYFDRVIDLRIEFRRHELAFAELEERFDHQNRYIHNLKAAYQHASLEMERRLTTLQREYQGKISHLLRQFNEEGTSSSGKGAHEVRLFEMEKQLYYYKHLSRELKGELQNHLNHVGSGVARAAAEILPGPSGVKSGAGSDPPLEAYHHRRSHTPLPSSASPMTSQVMPRRGRRFAMHSEDAGPTSGYAPSATMRVTRQKNKLIIQHKNGDSKQ